MRLHRRLLLKMDSLGIGVVPFVFVLSMCACGLFVRARRASRETPRFTGHAWTLKLSTRKFFRARSSLPTFAVSRNSRLNRPCFFSSPPLHRFAFRSNQGRWPAAVFAAAVFAAERAARSAVFVAEGRARAAFATATGPAVGAFLAGVAEPAARRAVAAAATAAVGALIGRWAALALAASEERQRRALRRAVAAEFAEVAAREYAAFGEAAERARLLRMADASSSVAASPSPSRPVSAAAPRFVAAGAAAPKMDLRPQAALASASCDRGRSTPPVTPPWADQPPPRLRRLWGAL